MRKNHTEINAFMEHFAKEFHANDEKTKHHEQGNSKKNKTHSSAQSEQKSDDKKCQSDSETDATTVHTALSLCQSSLKERTHTKKLNAIFFIYIHRHESRQEIVWISHHHEQLSFSLLSSFLCNCCCYFFLVASAHSDCVCVCWLPSMGKFRKVI